MASRPMSAPMPIRGWSRKSRSHPPISMTPRPVLKPCPTIPVRFLPIVPIAAIISGTLSARKAVSPGSSPPACGAATNRKFCASSMNGISRSIACVAGSRRSLEPRSAVTAFVGCDGEISPKLPPKSTSPRSPTTSSAHKYSCRPSMRIAPVWSNQGQAELDVTKINAFSKHYAQPRTDLIRSIHSQTNSEGIRKSNR